LLKKLKILVIAIFVLGYMNIYAQNEGNVWYFGYKAGLDFNSEIPTVLLNGDMEAQEGSSIICDVNGNLLLYSNAQTVWNRNHRPLPNGSSIKGGLSSSQSCILIPHPGNDNIIYLFTIDDGNGEFGFRYSEIHMDMDNELGDIPPGRKNKLLLNSVSEKITAVKHADNKTIWLIVHEYLDNTFFAYHIDENGFDKNNVVITNIGSAHTPISGQMENPEAALGCMKMSQKGNKLAVAIQYLNIFEVFDFNKNSGVLSNHVIVSDNNIGPYGVEFSADERFLYGSSRQGEQIFQWDMQAPDIKASIEIIGSTPAANGTLQLGPDGKIYLARLNSNYLGIIDYPERKGTDCNFDDRGIYLEGRLSSEGLPNIVVSAAFEPVFEVNKFCLGDITNFKLLNTGDVDSIKWNFDYPETGNYSFSADFETTHIFNVRGVKQIELITSRYGILDTVIQKIEVFPYPDIPFPEARDTTICENNSLILDGGEGAGKRYLWNDGSVERFFDVENNGEYYVEVNEQNCISRDTISVGINDIPVINFVNVTHSSCTENNGRIEIEIPGYNPDYLIMWSNGSTENVLENLPPGYYSVQVHDINGCFAYADTVINSIGSPDINIQASKEIICYGDSITLSAGQADAYLWNNNATSREIRVRATETMDYWVIGTNTENQCSTVGVYTMEVNPNPVPSINIPEFREACAGDEIILDAGEGQFTYLWNTAKRTPYISVSSSGTYNVRVTDTSSCYSDYYIDVVFHPVPKLDLGDEQAICFGDTIELNAGTWNEYVWNTGETDSIKLVYTTGTYRVTVLDTNYCEGRSQIMVWANDERNLLIDSVRRNEITCGGENDGRLEIFATGSWDKLLYSIDGGDTYLDNDGIFKNLEAEQEYIVAVKEEGACESFGNKYVFSDPPFMFLDSSIQYPSCEDCMDGYIKVLPSGGNPPYSYMWSDFITTQERIGLDPGQYTVRVTDNNKCSKYFTTDLTYGERHLYIPNAFTPNEDMINDTWIFQRKDPYPNMIVKVFDQAGKLLFESPPGYPHPWDGRVNSQDLPTNTYYYIIDLGNNGKLMTGTVTIIH